MTYNANDIIPMFSIIVPVYNVSNYLRSCIDSVLEQNYKDYEIIIIDDGSTDESGRICDEYAKLYPLKITCIHQKNAGLSEARNVGIKYAKGRYLVFLDGDDMLAVDALLNLECVIESENYPDLLISRNENFTSERLDRSIPCQYVFDTNRLKHLLLPDMFVEVEHLAHNSLGAWLFSPSADYIRKKKLYFYPDILHEDEEWIPKVILNSKTIAFNNAFLYRYRVARLGSITHTHNIRKLFDKIKITYLLENEFESYPDDYKNAIHQRVCTILFGILCDLTKFSKCDNYWELKRQTQERINSLKDSKRFIHRMAFLSSRVFGITTTSYILNTFSRKKEKWNSNVEF